MDIDPLTVFAVGGVASLLIERFFYYRSKYKEKKNEVLPESEPINPENPSHGERIATLEEAVDNQEKNNEKDHRLIRADIKKLGERIDRMKK